MLRKTISFITLVALIATLGANLSFAETSQRPYITSLASQADSFMPSDEDMGISLVFDETYLEELTGTADVAGSSGEIKIKKVEGDHFVKTIAKWGEKSDEDPAETFNDHFGEGVAAKAWDGTNDDTDTSDACGENSGSVCPAGNYKIYVNVYTIEVDTGDAYQHIQTSTEFSITEAGYSFTDNGGVAATNSTAFDPYAANATSDISFELATTVQGAKGYATVKITDDADNDIKTLLTNFEVEAGAHNKTVTGEEALAWDGKKTDGTVVADGTYTVTVKISDAETDGTVVLEGATDIIVAGTPPSNAITISSVTPATGSPYNPVDASNVAHNLDIVATTSEAVDSIQIEIENLNGTRVKNQVFAAGTTATLTWDGKDSTKFVYPGEYTAIITATKAGQEIISTVKYNVTYPHTSKPKLTDGSFTVSPESFDPSTVTATDIDFINENAVDGIDVEIWKSDNTKYKSLTTIGDSSSNTSHSESWNGLDTSSNPVANGVYKVVVIAYNDFGASIFEKNVTIHSDGTSIPDKNDHISSITYKPSSTFKPDEDDEFEIEFNVREDLDSLKIYAKKGNTTILIDDMGDVDEDNDVQATWDGTDEDGDYVEDGTWSIILESEKDSVTLEASRSKTFEIKYEEPKIDDLLISKSEIDTDLDEFTYIIFRVDEDAEVDIFAYEDGDEADEIVEDMDVEADKWYAVEWDGDGYDDGDDNIDVRLFARNKVNENIFDMEKEDIDFEEDDVASNKSNVTNDYIEPVIEVSGENMSIFYSLEDDADVKITIHKKENFSGSPVVTLLDVDDQNSGDHEVYWDGTDDDGKKLSKGIYSYKIISKDGSSDTEKGVFVIGSVGDIDGGGNSNNSGDSNNSNNSGSTGSGGTGSGVVVDGSSNNDSNVTLDGGTSNTGNCAGFTDVLNSSKYCDAIEWAKDEEIFVGYTDGTFKPYQAINRVEVLKVILEAMSVTILPSDSTNQGFTDVIVGDWYMPYIKTAKSLGIFHGDSYSSTARPGDMVNRVESLKFMFETLKIQKSVQTTACGLSYPDVIQNGWYHNYVCGSDQYNLFETNDGTNFTPNLAASRGEVALALYRLHESGLL